MSEKYFQWLNEHKTTNSNKKRIIEKRSRHLWRYKKELREAKEVKETLLSELQFQKIKSFWEGLSIEEKAKRVTDLLYKPDTPYDNVRMLKRLTGNEELTGKISDENTFKNIIVDYLKTGDVCEKIAKGFFNWLTEFSFDLDWGKKRAWKFLDRGSYFCASLLDGEEKKDILFDLGCLITKEEAKKLQLASVKNSEIRLKEIEEYKVPQDLTEWIEQAFTQITLSRPSSDKDASWLEKLCKRWRIDFEQIKEEPQHFGSNIIIHLSKRKVEELKKDNFELYERLKETKADKAETTTKKSDFWFDESNYQLRGSVKNAALINEIIGSIKWTSERGCIVGVNKNRSKDRMVA